MFSTYADAGNCWYRYSSVVESVECRAGLYGVDFRFVSTNFFILGVFVFTRTGIGSLRSVLGRQYHQDVS